MSAIWLEHMKLELRLYMTCILFSKHLYRLKESPYAELFSFLIQIYHCQ